MSGVLPVYLHPGVQAGALGAALARLGFAVEVLTARDHQRHPCIVVASGPEREVQQTGYVYAAPDQGGRWWFWRSVPDDPIATVRVAPLSEVSAAADRIARALTRARIDEFQAQLARTGQ